MTTPSPVLAKARMLTGPDRDFDYEIETLMLPFLTEYNYVRCDGDNGWYSSTPAVSGAEGEGGGDEGLVGHGRPYTRGAKARTSFLKKRSKKLLPGCRELHG